MVYWYIGIAIFDLLLFGGIGLLILKNEKIYLEDEGRWIPGFNLPRIYCEPGDEVNHKGFRHHVAWAFMRFGVVFTIVMIAFMYLMETGIEETYVLPSFLLILFGSILFLVWDMFTRTEKYVIRKVSKRIRYDKYIYRMVIFISIFNTVPMFFEEYLLQLVFVGMFLTFVVVVYYMYKIYVLLKENKKDFL